MQLSPTAASFTPIGMADNVSIGNQSLSLSRGFPSVSYLTANSDVDPSEGKQRHMQVPERSPPNYGIIGNSQIDLKHRHFTMVHEAFDTERRSRALVIENVPKNLTYMSLAGFFNVCGSSKVKKYIY